MSFESWIDQYSRDPDDDDHDVLKKLSNINPHFLAKYLLNEHPQTVAFILLHISKKQASQVILCFPTGFAEEVIDRLLSIDNISDQALADIKESLSKHFPWPASRRVVKNSDEFCARILGDIKNEVKKGDLDKFNEIQDLFGEPTFKKKPSKIDFLSVLAETRVPPGSNILENQEPEAVRDDNQFDELVDDEMNSPAPHHQDDDSNPGLRVLCSAALLNYERLPMLERIFDHWSSLMTRSVSQLLSINTKVTVEQISSLRLSDHLNSINLPSIIAVFIVDEWDGYGLMLADDGLFFSIIDARHGGHGQALFTRANGSYTDIERRLGERVFRMAMQSLSEAFAPLSPATFTFRHLETNPRFVTIARPLAACVRLKLRFEVDRCSGQFELLIPYLTLEPIRPLLLQMYPGTATSRDRYWEREITPLLLDVQVAVTLKIQGDAELSLATLLSLKAGSVLVLEDLDSACIILEPPLAGVTIGSLRIETGKITVTLRKKGPGGLDPDTNSRNPCAIQCDWKRLSKAEMVEQRPELTFVAAVPEPDPRMRMDMALRISLATTRLSMAQILALADQDCLHFGRWPGGEADLLANEALIARAEMIVIEEKMAAVVTKVIGRDGAAGP